MSRPIITCRQCGNDGEHRARGLCHTCYARNLHHGFPAEFRAPIFGPNAELDEIAVQRAVQGEWPPPELTSKERRAAVHALIARGLTQRQIAARIGCNPRTVARHATAAKETTR